MRIGRRADDHQPTPTDQRRHALDHGACERGPDSSAACRAGDDCCRHRQSSAANRRRGGHRRAVTPEPPILDSHEADTVTAEWRRRTQAEYTSAAIAQQVTLWLIQLGAPPDLIRDGLGVVDDELTHSELSAEVADRAGGSCGVPIIDPAALVFGGSDDPAAALVSSILRFFCIGETLAVPLFRMLRRRCSVPAALSALDRVMRDEARHRQFGWDVLDWALMVENTSVRDSLRDQVPAMLDDVLAAYTITSGAGPEVALSPNIAAWGLAPPQDYSRTVSSALGCDVLPRLALRGIEVA